MDVTGRLFGRRVRLLIAKPSGNFSTTGPLANAIEIMGADDPNVPGLRIVFKIRKTTQKEPNKAEIVVYNLSQETRSALQGKGLRILLEAGYVATGLAPIFVGDSRTTDHERDGADWKTIIRCGDGERAFQFARASKSFAGGSTVADVVKHCAESMGLALGNTSAQLSKLATPLYHGWTAHGAASSQLERVLGSVGYSFSVQDGEVQILAPGESVSQSIPLLDVNSGLIGSPELGTPEKKGKPGALKFKSLLLPQARAGGRVHVKSERIDGIFRLRKFDHDGDVRGAEWYTSYEGIADSSVRVA